MAEVSMKEMLEAGVHFGHQTYRWNPKMAPYIFTTKNGVHIFDLAQTKEGLEKALKLAQDIAQGGGTILFVGAKKQAKAIVKEEAEKAGMPFVNDRWLGGLLTNFSTILRRINHYKSLLEEKESTNFAGLSKKDASIKEKELGKLSVYLGGIKDLKKLPDALFVIDTNKEYLAVKEANKLGIPVIGIVDTNANPEPVDYIIPGNDDAIKAIKYLTGSVSSAILEGKSLSKIAAEKAEKEETQTA